MRCAVSSTRSRARTKERAIRQLRIALKLALVRVQQTVKQVMTLLLLPQFPALLYHLLQIRLPRTQTRSRSVTPLIYLEERRANTHPELAIRARKVAHLRSPEAQHPLREDDA